MAAIIVVIIIGAIAIIIAAITGIRYDVQEDKKRSEPTKCEFTGYANCLCPFCRESNVQ